MKLRPRTKVIVAMSLIVLLAGLTVASSVAGSMLHVGWDFPAWAMWAPWRLPGWWAAYSQTIPWPFLLGALAGSVIVGLWIALVRLYLIWSTPPVEAIGSGKWGTAKDAERAGLLQERGLIVGRLADHGRNRRKWSKNFHCFRGGLMAYGGPEHQLVAGASRSGKGVGHVIPSLLNWEGSALVYDIKGELWETTAGFRGRFGHVVRFAPTKGAASARFNPLMEIRREHMVRDAQNLAQILVDPTGEKRSLDIWDQNASQFLTALILHVLFTQPDDQKHLGRVRDMLMDIEQTIDLMMRTKHLFIENESGDGDGGTSGGAEVHPEIYRSAKSLKDQSERFRSSVKGTAEGYLILWADESIVAATAVSDFCASDLMVGKHPLTVYLEPPPSDADRLRPLMRAMLYQISRTLMENLEHDNRSRPKNHKLLLMLDEFPTLGRLPFIADNLRQMAGYGIKAHLIVQSFQDIADAYGVHNTIIDNCHIVVAFASADTVSAKRISEMTGVVTERRSAYSKRRLSPFDFRGRTESVSEHVRPLLTPGEVRELPADRQLVFVNGVTPLLTHKVRYYDDPHFVPRLIPAPTPAPAPGNDNGLSGNHSKDSGGDSGGGGDLPLDSAVSQDWIGCRAYDVVPLNAGADEAMSMPMSDRGGPEIVDEPETTTSQTAPPDPLSHPPPPPEVPPDPPEVPVSITHAETESVAKSDEQQLSPPEVDEIENERFGL